MVKSQPAPLTFGEMEVRRRQVAGVNANMRLEGLHPDASDIAIQARYVRGEASLEDLFTHAMEFARKSQVQTDLIGAVLDDIHQSQAAGDDQEATDRPLYYCDERFPNQMVREWPGGRCELVTVDLTSGQVVVTCDHVPDVPGTPF